MNAKAATGREIIKGDVADVVATLVEDGSTIEYVRAALADADVAKDTAYRERNAVVAALARAAIALGRSAWLGEHDPSDEAWEKDWRGIVFVDLPTGQVSWHIHDSERPLFEFLSVPSLVALKGVRSTYDGHTTPEKYERLRWWRP